MGTRGSFLGDKAAEREAGHSLPSSTEVKNAWSYTSILPIRLYGVVFSLKHGVEGFDTTIQGKASARETY
jgi:hypothetical protein